MNYKTQALLFALLGMVFSFPAIPAENRSSENKEVKQTRTQSSHGEVLDPAYWINPSLLHILEEERRRACDSIGDFEGICGENSNPQVCLKSHAEKLNYGFMGLLPLTSYLRYCTHSADECLNRYRCSGTGGDQGECRTITAYARLCAESDNAETCIAELEGADRETVRQYRLMCALSSNECQTRYRCR